MKNSIVLLLFFLTFGTAQSQTEAIKYGDNKEAGNYKQINGMQMYYETYGTGKPLVLLHGNGGSIKGHSKKIEYFKKYFQVIAIDSRGHGKSVDKSNKQLNYIKWQMM